MYQQESHTKGSCLYPKKQIHSQNVSECSVWTALRFKDRMVKVIMDVSALKDQKKGIVLQSTVSTPADPFPLCIHTAQCLPCHCCKGQQQPAHSVCHYAVLVLCMSLFLLCCQPLYYLWSFPGLPTSLACCPLVQCLCCQLVSRLCCQLVLLLALPAGLLPMLPVSLLPGCQARVTHAASHRVQCMSYLRHACCL